MKKNYFVILCILFLPLLFFACGEESGQWTEQHGYGPVTETLDLDDLNRDLALEGKQIFDTYCESCHTMNASISGPALGRVADRRTPEFVMNYTLNPAENRRNHPEGRKLAGQYSGIMADTGITPEQARAVLEYLRFYAERREDPEQ